MDKYTYCALFLRTLINFYELGICVVLRYWIFAEHKFVTIFSQSTIIKKFCNGIDNADFRFMTLAIDTGLILARDEGYFLKCYLISSIVR